MGRKAIKHHDKRRWGKVKRNEIAFASLYAVSLHWWDGLHSLGIAIDGHVALLVFAVLWGIAAGGAIALSFTWRAILVVFAIIYVVDLGVSTAPYLADIGAHSREIPLIFRPIYSLIFATIASSGLLLAFGLRALRHRVRTGAQK